MQNFGGDTSCKTSISNIEEIEELRHLRETGFEDGR
jgi:hypothetical protein